MKLALLLVSALGGFGVFTLFCLSLFFRAIR